MLKLTANHPTSIACKKAGVQLWDELSKAGVELTGVGVCLSTDKQNAAISINLLNDKHLSLVPDTYQGYEVKVHITGEIRPL